MECAKGFGQSTLFLKMDFDKDYNWIQWQFIFDTLEMVTTHEQKNKKTRKQERHKRR
jgi:hypothetical protein